MVVVIVNLNDTLIDINFRDWGIIGGSIIFIDFVIFHFGMVTVEDAPIVAAKNFDIVIVLFFQSYLRWTCKLMQSIPISTSLF